MKYTDMVAGRLVTIEAEYHPRSDDGLGPEPEEAFLLAVSYEGVDIRIALAAQHPEEFLRLRRECWARCLLEMKETS